MKRALLLIFTVASLLSCVALAVLWFRSVNNYHDQIVWHSSVAAGDRQSGFSFRSEPGYLAFWYETGDGGWVATPGAAWWFRKFDPSRDGISLSNSSKETPGLLGVVVRRVDGFNYEKGDFFDRPARVTGKSTTWYVSISYWLLTALCCLPAVAGMIAHRRQSRRRSAGVCSVCGYDMRATPNRCPECGTVPPIAIEAPA